MLEIYYKAAPDTPFVSIADFRAGSWIYVKEATLEDLTKIAEVAHLDLNDLRDSLDKYELPRMEHLDTGMIFFVRHPGSDEFGLHTQTLTIILTELFVITISPNRSEIIETFLTSTTPLNTAQKPKLILHILRKVTQDYTQNIKRVRHSILGSEQMPKTVDNHAIMTLTYNEEILNQYLTSLVPMSNLLETMSSERHMAFYEGDLDLLEDLTIAIRQSEDVCRVNIKSIRSMRDAYQIIFTNNVSRTIKLLTAVTIVFTIPTIIASIYGMNIDLPFQHAQHAFPLIMGITIIASVTTIACFRANRWL